MGLRPVRSIPRLALHELVLFCNLMLRQDSQLTVDKTACAR